MTKTPLWTAYQYRDVFILQPIVREDRPKCPYAKHYPVFVDFYIDTDEAKNEIELTALSLDRVKEICTLLTALSNFEFLHILVQILHGVQPFLHVHLMK